MTDFWTVAFPMPGQSEQSARRAEEAGWDGLYFPDTQCLAGDIYSAMCLASRATTTLKIGTSVTNPVTRHAAVTASAISTVQVESGGRAVLGVGRGDSSMGYIGRKPAPASLLDAYLADVQTYLRGDAVDIDGYESRIQWLGNYDMPKVPVDVAATGPRVIAIAARQAERITFALGADPARIDVAIASARATREAAGVTEPLEFGAYVNVACDENIDRARDIIRGSTGTFAHFSGMSEASHAGQADAEIFAHIGRTYDMANHASGKGAHMRDVPDEFISRFGITGSVDYCVQRIGELMELGLSRMVLLTGSRDGDAAATGASLQRITGEVFPQLRQ